MKRTLLGAVAALALSSSLAVADYPEREVLGVVMWGAGGATDTVARAVNPAAEEALGKPIVVLNKSGGAGAISTAFVNAAPADGYTFLYGAENPTCWLISKPIPVPLKWDRPVPAACQARSVP